MEGRVAVGRRRGIRSERVRWGEIIVEREKGSSGGVED